MKLVRLCSLTLMTLSVGFAFAADSEPLVLVKTIQLKGAAGKLDHLAVDSKGERLFLANKTNNTLDIVDLKTDMLVRQVADQGKVSGVAYAADLDMIYVGNGVGTCNAFDGRDFKPVFSTPTPNADNVHYHSGIQKVYVGQDEILSELDARTGQITASISLPGAVHGFRIDKRAGRIYAALTKPNLVAAIDISTHKVVDKYDVTRTDAVSPITQDVANDLLFLGCPKKQPMVLVIDSKTGKEIANVDIPAGVDDLHFDRQRNRLYASCSDSTLVVIQKKDADYQIVARLATPKDSRTCAWSSGRLYLGVPRQEGKPGPEIWIYEAPKVSEAK